MRTFCSFHQIDYPEIAEGIGPRHRFMSAYEQRIEPPDRRWQYLLMAAEPYETIAFKVSDSCSSLGDLIIFTSCSMLMSASLFSQVPSREIDKAENRFWTHWNRETKQVNDKHVSTDPVWISLWKTSVWPCSNVLFVLAVLPTISLQNGEASRSIQRSSSCCKCEAPPASYEWVSTTKRVYASSTRWDGRPPSPTWCTGCSYAPSNAHAPHANEATPSWWTDDV